MARILFVTGSTSGVGVGNLQHWQANTVLNTSLTRSVRMLPSSDDPHNVFLADRSEDIPDKNNITVQGILEKSQTTGASELTSDTDGLQANLTNAVVGAFSEAERNSSANQPMR